MRKFVLVCQTIDCGIHSGVILTTGENMEIIVLLVIVYIIAVILKRTNQSKTKPTGYRTAVKKQDKVRLTQNQQYCLMSASTTKPIYGSTDPMMNSHEQVDFPHHQKTIDSLVKRGYLVSDQKDGYLLTQEGASLINSGNF